MKREISWLRVQSINRAHIKPYHAGEWLYFYREFLTLPKFCYLCPKN